MNKIKSLLVLGAMAMASSMAWAQGTAPFAKTSWSHEGWTTMSTKNENVTSSILDATEIHYSDKAFTDGSATFTIAYGGSGSRRGYVNGVELIQNGKVKYSVYARKANNPAPHAVYTIDNIEAGTYTIKIWGSRNTDNEWVNSTTNVTVTQGANEIVKQTGIAVSAWTTVGTNELSEGLKAVCTSVGTGMEDGKFKYMEETVEFTEPCKGTVTYAYTGPSGGGNERLDILGFEILNASGDNVVSCDAHYGYAGSPASKNEYSYQVPAAGTYKVRTWIDGVREPKSVGTISYTYNAAEGSDHVFDPFKVYTLKATKAQRGYLTYNANAGVYGGPGLADVTLVEGNIDYSTLHPESTDAGVSINWQIYDNEEDGTAKIFNLQSGMFLVADGDYVKWGAEGTDFTVTEESDGTFHFKANGKYLCASCGYYEREGAARMVDNHEDACDFEVVDIDDVDYDGMNGFVIGEAGYATFYSDQPIFVPYGVTAYVLEASGEYLVATATGTVPANTGVVLAGEPSLYYVFPNANVHNVTSCLSGTTVDMAAPANCYVLGKEDDEIGFYKYTGTLEAYKAYYVGGANSNYRISFGELTGIISAAQQNGGQAIFDLQGRRVVEAKGLNIVNGKKVIR